MQIYLEIAKVFVFLYNDILLKNKNNMGPSIKEYYSNLTRIEKILFRELIMDQLGISYTLFYQWILRNYIPKHHKAQMDIILSKPIDKLIGVNV
jgi:hypothetical protein